jgi:hypothetical protein
MTNPILLPSPDSRERFRLLSEDNLRIDALARLYKRRDAVENLIRSLEDYQCAVARRPAAIREFISERKCS